MSDTFKIAAILGRCDIVSTFKFENGKMSTYTHRVCYDENGVETERTVPEKIGEIGFDDGTPFTEKDYVKITGISIK